MADLTPEPDALAKKLYVITIIGAALFVLAVLVYVLPT